MAVKLVDYLLVAVLIWLALLSFYLIRTVGHYRRLVKGGKNLNLTQILENILRTQKLTADQITQIEKQIEKLAVSQKSHFQKWALVRFNPFEDTGGDQSFIIAFLNGQNNGFIISSLHSRNSTRVYAKPVAGAKPSTHQFSKEEKEVVEKAARIQVD